MKKGQVSAEAIFALGLITLFFGFMLVYALERQQDVRDAETLAERRADCDRLANAITGLIQNPGSTANVTLDNNSTIVAASRVARIAGDVQCRLTTGAVTNGTFAPGTLILSSDRSGNVTVQHE